VWLLTFRPYEISVDFVVQLLEIKTFIAEGKLKRASLLPHKVPQKPKRKSSQYFTRLAS